MIFVLEDLVEVDLDQTTGITVGEPVQVEATHQSGVRGHLTSVSALTGLWKTGDMEECHMTRMVLMGGHMIILGLILLTKDMASRCHQYQQGNQNHLFRTRI